MRPFRFGVTASHAASAAEWAALARRAEELGYASLLVGGQFGALEKPQQERIAKIEKHVDALTQLINNLLDIARIESGRVAMERSPISVGEFLTTVQDLLRPQLEAKHIRYVPDLDGVTTLLGDPQHLQRVFLNLLSSLHLFQP